MVYERVRGWTLKTLLNTLEGRKHSGHCTECNGTIGQMATTGPIWYPGLDRIQSTKPNQENHIYRLRRSVPVISFPEKCAGGNLEATLYKTSSVRKEGKKEK